jgi:simple sugar transport system permease protein
VLALAGLGLLINERSGIVNLGAEGMMLVAAIAGFATAVHTGSTCWPLPPAPAPGPAGGHLRRAGDLAQHQPVRHRPGAEPVRRGFSAFVGIGFVRLGERASSPCPAWRTSPSSARRCSAASAGLRRHAAGGGLAWFLYRTRAGLVLRAVGESPESAHALGYPVRRIRLAA